MTLEEAVAARGLAVIGGFDTRPEHLAPEGVRAIAMLGLARDGWARFTASREASDGAADPLDRWSSRSIGALAEDMSAVALFPFGGPPYQPFLRWGAATGRVWPSALGMSIHDERGLWVSFRGALGFDAPRFGNPEPRQGPCETCLGKPCLSACPVDAFAGDVYDVSACVAHLSAPEGAECLSRGCLARRACPVGRDWTPEPDRAGFHMGAFRRAREDAA